MGLQCVRFALDVSGNPVLWKAGRSPRTRLHREGKTASGHGCTLDTSEHHHLLYPHGIIARNKKKSQAAWRLQLVRHHASILTIIPFHPSTDRGGLVDIRAALARDGHLSRPRRQERQRRRQRQRQPHPQPHHYHHRRANAPLASSPGTPRLTRQTSPPRPVPPPPTAIP